MTAAGVDDGGLPVLVFDDGTVLARPSQGEIAAKIGLHTEADLPFYDLVIVGGGPAALAAAVYGASEGLRTLLVERHAAGGQAGQSSRIENYLGFPAGLSGADLARRATAQAQRLGAELLTSREVLGIRENGPLRVVALDGGEEIGCHSAIIATGVHYARLDAPGVEALTGSGVYYGAAAVETAAVEGEDAAITGAAGHGRLEALTVAVAGRERRLAVTAAFVFIGARPQTDWLGDTLARDERGFIVSGAAVRRIDGGTAGGSSATRFRSRRACPASSSPATSATSPSSA